MHKVWKSILALALAAQLFGLIGGRAASASSGNTWSSLGAGLGAPGVRSIAASGTDIYVGGMFTTAGGNPANRIVKWDGSQWSALGTGMNLHVFAVAASGIDVYAGGIFGTAGGVATGPIAKWNGSSWSALGSGLSGTVYSIAVSGTDVYVGGSGLMLGGSSAGNIVKWDGTSWSKLGTGLNSAVYTIAVSGTDVYVGGDFITADGSPASHIAKWNGSSWSSLGAGLSGTFNASYASTVYAITVAGSNVYAGGNFITAGGTSAKGIAKWNGSSWSSLGTGVDNTVNALAASGDDVYAGGNFSTAGGIAANLFAKWDGSGWSSMGSGFNGSISAITVSADDVYAGGAFTTADGNSASYIAKWTPAGAVTATPVITGTVRAGDTSITGTAAAGATVTLSVNGVPASPVTAAGGSWTISGLTLAEGDAISVTAQSAGEVISDAATATVAAPVPVVTDIAAFDAIGDVAAGTVGATAYANGAEISAALMTSHSSVTANGGNITVPVNGWVDTDGYNAAVAGSYTFTATLGSLPVSTTNTGGLTVTVEVVVSPKNITAFDAIGDVSAGTVGAAAYDDGAAVSAALLASHATVTANGSTITVPVSGWVDTDGYNPLVAGSYTFTATLGSLPVSTTNTGGLTATVEVVVSPKNITAFDAIGDVSAGTVGAAAYDDGATVSAALLASHATVTANGGTITVPVSGWVDTDGYNPLVAGSYTFTATLGSLPASTTNTGGLTATVEVIVSPKNITAFDAIDDVSAGIAGSAAYANGADVSLALLASHVTVTANGGTITVPVTGWTDTDGYNPLVAGSYTFTATLSSLPASTTNTGGLTATVEVVVSPKNITSFDAIGDVSAGTAGSAAYANGADVSLALLASHVTVTANGGTITVPVTGWTDTDSYNPLVAGSYTFTATLGSLPASITNTGGLTATVEVIVSPKNITAFDAIDDVSAGTAGSATYADGASVSTALLASQASVTANGGSITVPVTGWTNTDSYNPLESGSYTFTATLGSLPASTTNTGGLTATVEVVVSPKNITAFDAIGNVSAGTVGAAAYDDGAAVSAALLASHATVTANGGTIMVPVTGWVDTDGYTAAVAGSYTFTATLGSLPTSTTNTGGLTATVEVVVSPRNITAFDAIDDVSAGTAGSATYADGADVSLALLASHGTVTANGGTINVPVTSWTDTDSYNPLVAGSYTFTATLGSLPTSTTNTGGLTATVEVVVSPKNITAFDAIDDVSAGIAKAATYANGADVSSVLLASHATVTANGCTITVPVTGWTNTDGYNPLVAGSYTFTATLGSLPASTTNTGGLTATVEVVVSPRNITAFDAIDDVSAGIAGSATYANGADVSSALLASHTTVTANGGTITVLVTGWTDTDSYNPLVAGSYTFTATLGSLPASTTNTGGLTATVEVVVSPKNIAAFDAIDDVSAGIAGSATYADGADVSTALLANHATVTANGGTVMVPVTSWMDTDGYNASVAGSYIFTATLGSLPASTTNTGSLTATVEVIVSPKNISAFDAIDDVSAGTAGSATYADGASVSTALLASHASVTANGGTITVPVASWEDTDGYNPLVAGSYTFTATLGSLPASTTNTGGLTATVEVVVSPKNITAFDAIDGVSAGTAGSATYADGASVSAALLASHSTVAANGGTITVPVTSWIDTDGYNPAVPGSYTFTATLGSLPASTTNTDNRTATIEVVVTRKIGGSTSTTPVTDTPVTSTDGKLLLPAGKKGTVSLENEVVISIPANATDRELQLTIEKLLNTQQLLTDRNVSASSIFEILKNFQENFHNPVSLTFSFDQAKLSGDQTVAVFYFDEAKKEWVEVPGGKINENRITVEVNHFTKYGVFVIAQAAAEPSTPDTDHPLTLTDIAGHWAEAGIKRAISNGIVAGYPDGTFAPNRTVTRAEFAVMLMNTLKPTEDGATLHFADDAQIGSWAQQAVAQAVQAGVVNGYKDGSFRPNAEITRAEMVTMIANALKLNAASAKPTGFADDKNIPGWAISAVSEVHELGLVEGKSNNNFDPAGDATRAEAVTILLRMWDYRMQSSQRN